MSLELNPFELVAIAARSANNIMGNDGGLPWPHNKQDMIWFMRITAGDPLIMGRKTYESLPGILKDRIHVVVSRNATPEYITADSDGIFWCHPDQIPNLAKLSSFHARKAFVIGGAELFETMMPMCNVVMLRTFNEDHAGDVKFPSHLLEGRKLILSEKWNDSITETYTWGR